MEAGGCTPLSEGQRTIKVRVFRFNPALDREPRYDVFTVPYVEGSTVSNILQYLNEEHDGGLAHYLSCRRGICAECMVRVNGKAVLGCIEQVRGDVTIEPVAVERVIKDLLVGRPAVDD
jgi:succinate dehydrogenase/fumarate reductase-like Fe-S protein